MFDITPFRNRQRNLFNYLNELDREFFTDMPSEMSLGFKTDVIDKDNKYILQAELPGFSKEDINIDIDGDYLTISAQHSLETEEKKENFIRKERKYGAFSRSFNISNIKSNEITAEYKNGILELILPKQNTENKKQLYKIEIK